MRRIMWYCERCRRAATLNDPDEEKWRGVLKGYPQPRWCPYCGAERLRYVDTLGVSKEQPKEEKEMRNENTCESVPQREAVLADIQERLVALREHAERTANESQHLENWLKGPRMFEPEQKQHSEIDVGFIPTCVENIRRIEFALDRIDEVLSDVMEPPCKL